MENFFCAEESRQANEKLIGYAICAPTYVLIECLTPWAPNALDTQAIPDSWRALVQDCKQTGRSLRPLLIYNEKLAQPDSTRVIILQKPDGLAKGYLKQEFLVPDIESTVAVVQDYLAGQMPSATRVVTPTRDILVCTHGSHDQCCARYGNGFYRQAIAAMTESELAHVRVWQASHIGGHRFAPTAIDFPEGRYYGRLERESFKAILTRAGDIHTIPEIYRGAGLLPPVVQPLEQELLLQVGWDWFNYKIEGRIVEQTDDGSLSRVELTVAKLNGSVNVYQAEVTKLADCTALRGSCSSTETHSLPQYSVQNITEVQLAASPA